METSLNRDSRHTHPNQEECYNVENDVYHIDSMTETSLNRYSNHTHHNPKECYNVENDVYHVLSIESTIACDSNVDVISKDSAKRI